MPLPPGLEFLRTPFMAAVGTPQEEAAAAPTSAPRGLPVPVERSQRGERGVCEPGAIGESGRSSRESRDLAEQVKQAVALDIDVKIAERLESVYMQGEVRAKQFLVESRNQQEELLKKIAEIREREVALEMENASLQQLLLSVLGQITQSCQWAAGVNGMPVDFASLTKAPAADVPDACADGSSTTASEKGGSGGETSSPHLGAGVPPAPSSDSGGSSDCGRAAVEPPPGLEMRTAAKLPDVPPFPFPAVPQAAAAPFSLAGALGIEGFDPSQEAIASPPGQSFALPSLSPMAPVFNPFATEYGAEAFPPFSFDFAADASAEPADGFIFNITLRKAVGSEFGLATSSMGQAGALLIEGILPGGAAEAWNRQCSSSGAAEKVLLPGDSIVSVNSITGSPEEMKAECETSQVIRLMVVRSDGPRSAPPQHVATVSDRPSTLRAEASSFVPLSADADEFVPMGMAACVDLPAC